MAHPRGTLQSSACRGNIPDTNSTADGMETPKTGPASAPPHGPLQAVAIQFSGPLKWRWDRCGWRTARALTTTRTDEKEGDVPL